MDNSLCVYFDHLKKSLWVWFWPPLPACLPLLIAVRVWEAAWALRLIRVQCLFSTVVGARNEKKKEQEHGKKTVHVVSNYLSWWTPLCSYPSETLEWVGCSSHCKALFHSNTSHDFTQTVRVTLGYWHVTQPQACVLCFVSVLQSSFNSLAAWTKVPSG